MVDSKSFYESRKKTEEEKGVLEERIAQAYCATTPEQELTLFNEDGSVKSPFEKGYKVNALTKGWLLQYGWYLEGDKICPIAWKKSVASE